MLKNSRIKVWMFHYVRPCGNEHFPYMNFFSYDLFCKFLDENIEKLKVDTEKILFDHLAKQKDASNEVYILTFDDGLSDHYKWVFPALQERGIKGIFFINTKGITGEMLTVHKLHLISGHLGYAKFIEIADPYLHERLNGILIEFPGQEQIRKAYPYDNADVARFKYKLNYIVEPMIVDEVLDSIIAEFPIMQNEAQHFYLNKDQIKEMHEAGMLFGYHGHTHRPFSLLSDMQLQDELALSDSILASDLPVPLQIISYPYGDGSSVTTQNIDTLRSRGIKLGFMAEYFADTGVMQLSRLDHTLLP